MMFHGAPLIKCKTPSCKKCHCNECEFTRQTSLRFVVFIEKPDEAAVFFHWSILAQQMSLVLKLDIK